MVEFLSANKLKAGHVYRLSKENSVIIVPTPQYQSYWENDNFTMHVCEEFLVLSEAFPTSLTSRNDLCFLHIIGVNKEFTGWAILTSDYEQFTKVVSDVS